MKNLARGSVLLLSLVGFGAMFLYFQPTVEAVTIATDSQGKIRQEIIEKNVFYQENFQAEFLNEQGQIFEESEASKSGGAGGSEGQAFRATAYCLKGRTASGSGVRRGIVAADPRVLPLGTKINVSAGAYSGTYTVADTGGAIKGRILDIWVPSCSEAVKFGRRTVKVSVAGR